MKALERRHATPSGTTVFPQVLIILFGALFFGGSGSEPLPKRIKGVVEDPARRDRAVEIARELEERRDGHVEVFLEWRKSFYETMRTDSDQGARVQEQLDGLVEGLRTADLEALDLHMQLRDQIEKKEWRELFD